MWLLMKLGPVLRCHGENVLIVRWFLGFLTDLFHDTIMIIDWVSWKCYLSLYGIDNGLSGSLLPWRGLCVAPISWTLAGAFPIDSGSPILCWRAIKQQGATFYSYSRKRYDSWLICIINRPAGRRLNRFYCRYVLNFPCSAWLSFAGPASISLPLLIIKSKNLCSQGS